MRGCFTHLCLIVAMLCVLSTRNAVAQEPELAPLPMRELVTVMLTALPEVDANIPLPLQVMSEEGIVVLKMLEAFRPRAYRDGGGGYSIGYGFQRWKGRRVTLHYPGRVTRLQADIELRRQIQTYEDIVQDIDADLPQEAFDSFVSIAYNLGRVNNTICWKIAQHHPVMLQDFLSTAKVRNRTDWRLQGRRTREFLMLLGDYEGAKLPVVSPREVRATCLLLQKERVIF